MTRVNRADQLDPDAIEIAHVFNRLVRRCFLMGDDPVTGNNYDHRKNWVEAMMQVQAKYFAIDLLGFSIMSNHFHQILRSRPDAVQTWDDSEVALPLAYALPRTQGERRTSTGAQTE